MILDYTYVMSLDYTYVKAVDGNYYRDPVLSGPDWFICFDDTEPPELVIRQGQLLSSINLARAKEILSGLDFNYKLLSTKPNLALRCFGKEIGDGLYPAGAYFFVLDSPIPIPTEHKGVVNGRSITSGTVYSPLPKKK
jgi:hypothetical protein